MKRSVFACLLAVVVAAAFALAQTPAGPSAQPDTYVVQPGDTLWVLEGTYNGNPAQWRRLVELNPFLKAPGRIFEDEQGRTIALIRPGEELRGLKEMGIIPSALPLDKLRAEALPAPKPAAAAATTAPTGWSWLWWLLLIPAVLLLWALVAYQRMRQNPATAGPAIVPRGVTDRMAATQFRENISQNTGLAPDRIEIRDLVRGRIYGAVSVRYRDNRSRRMLLAGQTGYRALVRRDGGPWAEEYMLQACGNDLRLSGARYIPGFGFRFVPEAVVEETPRPTPVRPEPPVPHEPVVPVPDPPAPTPVTATPDPPASVSPVDNEGEKHFTFKPAGKGRPNLVSFEGFTSFEVEVRDGRTQVRFS